MNSPAPGWLPDPTSRHQYRYWNGARWTDDVADDGVASTDALGVGAPPGSDPNASADPTYPADSTQQVDPTQQYPIAGQAGPSTPYYGEYYAGSEPSTAAARKGPPAGLIAALAVLAVALVGGLVYFLVRDDDGGSGDNAAEISDGGSSTTDPNSGDNGDGNDSGAGDSGTSDGTLPNDMDSANAEQLVELMADNLEQAAGGVLSHEDAKCISQGMLDELGLERIVAIGESGDNPFTDPELTSRLFSIMEDCGVSLEDLATAPD